MAANQMNLPPGFQLEQEPNLPPGFQIEQDAPAALGTEAIPPSRPPVADPTDVGPSRIVSPEEEIYMNVRHQLSQAPAEPGAMIGGTIGGTLGPVTIGQIPPLTFLPEEAITIPLSAALGAYAGGAGGSALQQSLYTPGNVVDWKGAHRAGLWEAGSELAGRGLVGGIKTVGKVVPFSLSFKQPARGPGRTLLPQDAMATKASRAAYQSAVKQFEAKGGVMTPAQVDKRWWLHVFEAFARGSWVGSEAFEEVAKRNDPILVEMLKDTVDEMVETTVRKTPSQVGEDLSGAIARRVPGGGRGTKIAQWHALFDPIYAQVDDLAKGSVVSTKGLKDYADIMLNRDQVAKGRLLESSTRQDLLGIKKIDDNVSLQTMRDLRTKWQGKVRQFSKDMNPDIARVNDLSQLADDAIMNAATSPNLDPQARALLQTANRHYVRYKRMMDDVFPMRLAEKLRTRPEVVVTDVFPVPKRQSQGALHSIERVRDALSLTPEGLPDPQGKVLFDELRQAWLSGLIAQNTEKGTINIPMLRAQLGRYGPESLDILLPLNERRALEGVLNVAEAARKPGMMSGGALVAKSAQAAGAGYLLYRGGQDGDFIKAAAGGSILVFGPIAYARLATHPVGSRLLRSGLPQVRGHREMATMATRLIRLLMAEQKKDDDEARKLQMRYERMGKPIGPRKPSIPLPDRPLGYGL